MCIYLIAGILIYSHRFHAILLRQSSGRERKILEKSKNRKIQSKNLYVEIVYNTFFCVRIFMCVCVDYIYVSLYVVTQGSLSDICDTKMYGRALHFSLDCSTLPLIIIIIIMSCRYNGYPWPSLDTSPYHSSPLAGLQGYILYLHIAAVCKFELVVLLLLGHMWGP